MLCSNCGYPAAGLGQAKPTKRTCPCGIGRMYKGRMGGVVALVCRHCGGVWFSWGQLNKLIRTQPSRKTTKSRSSAWKKPALSPRVRREKIRCIRCRRPMRCGDYGGQSGIEVDWCEGHGVWLDPSELPLLLKFVRTLERGRALLDAVLSPRWKLF